MNSFKRKNGSVSVKGTTAITETFLLPKNKITAKPHSAKLHSFELLLKKIRNASHKEIKFLVKKLQEANLLMFNEENEKRRVFRRKEYFTALSPLFKQSIHAKTQRILDLGTGDGTLFSEIIELLSNKTRIIPCSGDLVDYCNLKVRKKIGFRKLNSIRLPFKNNTFDISSEIVMLHHLNSLNKYKLALKELVRVTKNYGRLIIVETVHKTKDEHCFNAILDIYLNNLTSLQYQKKRIPVPVQFLSVCDLEQEFKNLKLKLLKKVSLPRTENDPKFHIAYLLQK